MELDPSARGTATARRARTPARGGVRALTSDLWFTLAYLRPSERMEAERLRRAVWTEAVTARGIDSERAIRLVAQREEWIAHRERAGRAPSIPRQAEWLSQKVGREIEATAVSERLDRILRLAPVRAAPGAKHALRALARSGVELGVVSNIVNESSDGALGLLERLGFAALFSAVKLSCDLPWSKPDPRPFRACLETLGVRAGVAAHVGDRDVDVIGARAAGMTPILYTGLHAVEFPGGRPPAGPEVGEVSRAPTWGIVMDLVGSASPPRVQRSG